MTHLLREGECRGCDLSGVRLAAFLPPAVTAKVYALFIPDRRTDHPHKTQVSTSSTEDKMLQALGRN